MVLYTKSTTAIKLKYTTRVYTAEILKPRLHDTTCCQTGCQTSCQTGLTTGCIVYTAGCQTGCTARFDNRVERTDCSFTGLTTG